LGTASVGFLTSALVATPLVSYLLAPVLGAPGGLPVGSDHRLLTDSRSCRFRICPSTQFLLRPPWSSLGTLYWFHQLPWSSRTPLDAEFQVWDLPWPPLAPLVSRVTWHLRPFRRILHYLLAISVPYQTFFKPRSSVAPTGGSGRLWSPLVRSTPSSNM
jgi:hypothetical protein